jgi:hypothetical protein
MAKLLRLPKRLRRSRILFAILSLAVLSLFSLAACQKTIPRTDDPQLKPIQEMLDAQLPPGTPSDRVATFLASRGYPTEPVEKPGTMVAIIRHIDTERVEPVTARVTFYFDANNKLNTFELQRTFNERIPE